MKLFIIFLTLTGWISSLSGQTILDKEGHRGCRGLMPENTIPAMKKAIDLKVNTLEMDIIISSDKLAIVSHDPDMNPDIALTPDGKSILPDEEKKYVLYKMRYDEIRRFDVGSKPYPKFPQQKKLVTYKPLLSELIDSVENYVQLKNLPGPFYNIEIKSTPEGDNVLHPEPQEFVDIVMKVLSDKNILDRVIIQSFDTRPLEIVHKQYPDVMLSYLTANIKGVKRNLKKLDFHPSIYSPYYKIVRKRTVRICHQAGIRVVPWTVDTRPEMDKLIRKGVDGIITDYPDLFLQTE